MTPRSPRDHAGKQGPVQPNRRHEVEVDLGPPFFIGQDGETAGRCRRTAEHVDHDVDATEPLVDGRSRRRRSLRRRQVRGDEILRGDAVGSRPGRCENRRAKVPEQANRCGAGPPRSGGDEGALALKRQSGGHQPILTAAIKPFSSVKA